MQDFNTPFWMKEMAFGVCGSEGDGGEVWVVPGAYLPEMTRAGVTLSSWKPNEKPDSIIGTYEERTPWMGAKQLPKNRARGGEGRVTPYLLSSLPGLLFFPKGLLPRSCQTNFQRLTAWHSLAVQGRLLASSAESMGPITGRGTKILNATQCGQINII